MTKEWRRSGTARPCDIVARCKARAKERGLPFNLDAAYVADLFKRNGGKCAITGVSFLPGEVSPFSLSVDRISAQLGYVKGNIRLILMAVNCMRMNGTDKDVHEIALAIVKVWGRY